MTDLATPYSIGKLQISNSIGRILLLSDLDSPFVSASVGDIPYTDVAIAIYIMAEGPQVAAPALAYRRAMDELNAKPIEQVTDYAEALALVADRWSSFAADAMAYYEAHVDLPAPAAVKEIVACINQIVEVRNG
jgi:hypothetical protein